MNSKDVVTIPRDILVRIEHFLKEFDYFTPERLNADDKFVIPRWIIKDVLRAQSIVRHVLAGGTCLVCYIHSEEPICGSCLADIQQTP
jgi:hypothetical protein